MESLLSARSFEHLVDRLRSIDVTVPIHPKDRKNGHVETYVLVSLLGSIPWSSNCFPVEIFRHERPDFLIKCNALEIGLEHTEASNQNIAKERALRADGHGPEMHFVTPASVHDQPKSSKQVLAEITADEMGDGFVGDSVERNWAEAMAYFIDKKASSAKKDGYKRCGDDRLMIYDGWPAPGLTHDKALSYLRERLIDSTAWSVFSRIYIVDEHTILELGARQTTYHRVRR